MNWDQLSAYLNRPKHVKAAEFKAALAYYKMKAAEEEKTFPAHAGARATHSGSSSTPSGDSNDTH